MSSTPPPAALRGRTLGTLLVLCGALFLDTLDVSMMSVALPSIEDDLDIGTSGLQWVVSAYVLGYGGFLLLGGRAADLLGRRRMFVWSMAAFCLFSGLGGFATEGSLLIAARFITGIAAAFTAPAGLSIITTTFPEGPVRNKALSIFTATGATGFALGLVVGGALTEMTWRLVFFVPVVISSVILVGAVRIIPRGDEPVPSRRGFDIAGAVTVTGAMLLLVYTLVEAPNAGWASARTVGSFAGVVALLGIFTTVEQHSAAPLVRLGILRSASLLRSNIGALCLLGGWVGCLFVITLYMQEVRGWSALQTGLAVFPSGVLVALVAPRIAPPLVARFGTAPVIAAGLASHAVGYVLLLGIDADAGYLTGLLPTVLLVGIGFALAYGPLTISATAGVAEHEQGLAGGLVNTAFQIGPALVLAIVTAVNDGATVADGTADGLLEGFHAALFVPLIVAVVGTLVTISGLVRRRAVDDAPGPDPCSSPGDRLAALPQPVSGA